MRKSFAAIALIRREHDDHTEWLAQWNKSWDVYSFVGGHKRADESFRECLLREIQEELGLAGQSHVLVGSAPVKHLEFEEVSRRTGAETAYTVELFEVSLVDDAAEEAIAANRANRWLTEDEIMAGHTSDGWPVSPTLRQWLREQSGEHAKYQ